MMMNIIIKKLMYIVGIHAQEFFIYKAARSKSPNLRA